MGRTWTATINVQTGGRTETIDATPSASDLLRDQVRVAVAEASLFLDDSAQVWVAIWKTTQARGLEVDRTYTVTRDQHGVAYYR